jgi:hypothetical protein
LSHSLSYAANTNWSNKLETKVGYTSNVYQLSDNVKSDFFTELLARSNFNPTPALNGSLYVGYTSYFKETANNVLNWSLSAGRYIGDWDSSLRLRGQHYTNGSPGLSDENFDYIGLLANFLRDWPVKQIHTFEVNPSYEFRNYTGQNRNDHILSLAGILDWKLDYNKTLSPMSEMELVSSSVPEFTRASLLLRLDYLWKPSDTLKHVIFASSKYSTYPDRTVGQEVIVINKRGPLKTTVLDQKETVNNLSLGASTTKILSTGEVRGTAQADHQISRSGYLDYSEILLSVAYNYKF